jgi:hypothetical protein
MELRHSGSIARRDLSQISDEELLRIIYSVGSDIGLAPVKEIEPNLKTALPDPYALRLVPKT